MNIIVNTLNQTLVFAIPLLIVALGGMFSERSGVINIALEGIMIGGAFVGVFFIYLMETNGVAMNPQLLLVLALLIAGLFGALFSLLHAFAAINLKADQTISGTAINMLAPGLGLFLAKLIFNGNSSVPFENLFRIHEIPVLSQIPFIGPILFKGVYITTYLGIAILIISAIFLYKTKSGLRLRACGENPQAADAAGINVYKYRYIGVLLSGFLGGMGGLIYIIPISSVFNSDVGGYGFLALAILIFGNWQPYRIAAASLFFGIMKTLAYTYTTIPVLVSLGLPSVVYKLIPYIATLILLAFTSKDSAAPKASGIPYDKSKR